MASGLPSQNFIPIESVRDGVILLKNGEYRSIIMTSSVNLSLKSDDEQSAIYLQFQNLLNSLDFPLQIFAQSRRLDIRPYLTLLDERKGLVKEDLLKVQISEYIEFIRKFTEESNIMTKHFFVVVPYVAIANGTSNKVSPFLAEQKSKNDFEQIKTQLGERVTLVTQGLNRLGVRSVVLNTEEVVELFYKQFNPGEQDHSTSVPTIH